MPDSNAKQGVLVEISPGELIDKISILQIKARRITDSAKRANVDHELKLLEQARDQATPVTPELAALTEQLRRVNEELWEIEDAIRVCERDRDFGQRFVELARGVYQTNDERAALKRRINEALGAIIIEEKQYVDYQEERVGG